VEGEDLKGRVQRLESLQQRALSRSAFGAFVSASIIWRPGGVNAGNVVTRFADVQAALDRVQGAASVFVDSSLAPAIVPPGHYTGYGCAQLFPFDTGQGFIMTVSDGATLHDFASMQGLTVLCECKTAQAFAFNPFSSFLIFNFATISLDVGALVPAIRVSAAAVTFTMFARMGSLDNSSAPTVPVIATDAGAFSTFYVHTAAVNFSFLTTGNEIGGPVGSEVFWENDDTTPPLSSTLFFGTLQANASSISSFTVYSPAAPADWVFPPPATVAAALDRIAANHANVHPIP
jgi:hypothetical protein